MLAREPVRLEELEEAPMKFERDDLATTRIASNLVFETTGRREYVNEEFVSCDPNEPGEIRYGSDGEIFNLTPGEREVVGRLMIERWTQWLAAGNTDQESTK